jgi:LysR family glycine cleavage system transcriptional activator/LysR family transcriptional regulator of beta-lactamase
MRKLPSLNGLRAFEVSARLGSFAAAGQELAVTQAAVSRMVRLLEQRLGYALFERHANRLTLTWQGRTLLPGLTSAFDAVATLAAQIGSMSNARVLTVGVGTSFAIRWLIPRLGGFQERHPDIEVRIATGGARNPIRDDWTCGIVLGDGNWPGFEADPLFSADLFPVCGPVIAKRLATPADLRNETLLQVAHQADDWPSWLRAAGLKLRPEKRGPRFDNYALALQAAVDGLGVAIGLRPYVEDDLTAGRLVAPFTVAVPKDQAWYLIASPARRDDPSFAAFRTWLLEHKRQ